MNLSSVGKKLYAQGLITSVDGNFSLRKRDHILITPKGIKKDEIKEEDLSQVSFDGKVLKGNPSSELDLHLKIYQKEEKIKAIIHAHPPAAIALSLAKPDLKSLPLSLPETLLLLGEVPILPYKKPGDEELSRSVLPFLKKAKAFILAQHGALSVGESLKEAFTFMELVEHACKIFCMSEALGKTNPLPKKEQERLLNLFKMNS